MELEGEKLEVNLGSRGTLAEHVSFEDKDLERERHFMLKGTEYEEVTSGSATTPTEHNVRDISLRTTQDFIAYAKKYIDAKSALVLYNEERAVAFFDEVNREERATVNFGLSLEYRKLLGENGSKVCTQKDLVSTLLTFKDAVASPEGIITKLSMVKVLKDATVEGTIDEDNIKVSYQSGGGKQVMDIPKNMVLRIPVIEGSSHTYNIEVELDVDGEPGTAIVFELTNHAHERTVKTAVEQEGADIREALTDDGDSDVSDYNVYFGASY